MAINRITNEQREAIVREAIAKRDAFLAGSTQTVWQTKDSPPPDGVAVLVRWPDTNPEADVPWRYAVARYESKRALHHWWSATSSLPHAFVVSPSHWQAIAH